MFGQRYVVCIGSKPQFASPKDQDAYFSDFSVAIIQSL